MDGNQFRQLLKRFGFSWEGYRKVRKLTTISCSGHIAEVVTLEKSCKVV
jgi:hypothetical protein